MRAQVINPESSGKVVLSKIRKLIIARRFAQVPPSSWIAEVVRLIDYHDIRQFGDALEAIGEIPFSAQIRMAENCEITEICTASNVRQPLT